MLLRLSLKSSCFSVDQMFSVCWCQSELLLEVVTRWDNVIIDIIIQTSDQSCETPETLVSDQLIIVASSQSWSQVRENMFPPRSIRWVIMTSVNIVIIVIITGDQVWLETLLVCLMIRKLLLETLWRWCWAMCGPGMMLRSGGLWSHPWQF